MQTKPYDSEKLPDTYYIDDRSLPPSRNGVTHLSPAQRGIYTKPGRFYGLEILSNRTVAAPNDAIGHVELLHHGLIRFFPNQTEAVTTFQAPRFWARGLASTGPVKVIAEIITDGDRVVILNQVESDYILGGQVWIEECVLKMSGPWDEIADSASHSDDLYQIDVSSLYVGDLQNPSDEHSSVCCSEVIFLKNLNRFNGTLKITEPNGEIRIGLLTESANVSFETPSGATIKIFACQNPRRFGHNKNIEILHPNMPAKEVSEQALWNFFRESPAFRALFDKKDRMRISVQQAHQTRPRRRFRKR
jgi:hypothetical protein